ncbi:MAG TPA: DUF1648 domain-containing protein [Candidatus Methylacidiphilales bacterium]|nr:DUF1648 domain-containing protein [Candidatus Methylacidiphilales bacterium]
MNSYRAGAGLLLALVVVSIVHIAVYYPALLAVVASHFDLNGKVNGTMSREAFVGVYAGVVAIMAVVFYGIGLLLPVLPNSSINMPHKDFWLAQERRSATLESVAAFLVWIGAATLLFIMATIHITIMFQLGQISNINILLYPMLAVYFVALTTWTLLFVRKFRNIAA